METHMNIDDGSVAAPEKQGCFCSAVSSSMELECDLSKINNEELLRKMWQQSEDTNRKKEIRSQLYKLRESRLRDLYQGDIMADNSVAGFGKDPLVTSHGDALADQSFQSLKSKEIRDSLSPTEMKFQSMALNNPNTTGWNVQTSKEVSPDGRGFRAETVATTDGVESVNGGIAEFKGRNEQLSSAHHQGDDKNFVKKAMESSNSHLQEKVVIGDENSGRTEVRTSSTKSSSSSQVIKSSTNVEYEDGLPIKHQPQPQKYLMDSDFVNQQDLQQRQQMEQQQQQQRLLEEQRIYEQEFQQKRQQHLNQHESRTTEQKNISQNIQTQETHEQNKRYVDMDKASPEYQQHVQHLMQQPGEIISSTVEYPKPNVKMITTVKRLPDGTIVRNKRYETEELTPTKGTTTRPTTTAANQTPIRRDSQQPSRNYQPDSSPHSRRTSQDMVDNSNTSRYVQDSRSTDDVETKFSSTKKSSNKFSTETTSETIQEIDDHHAPGGPSARPKPKTNDFSTHGFPSVRANKPTQEYPTERPHATQPTQGYPAQPRSARLNDATDNITERRVNTKDGEVIIVSSEKKSNFKTSTNSERIIETEHITHDDQPHQGLPHKTHGFPSVREPSGHNPNEYPSERQMLPQEQDFPLNKLPAGTRITTNRHLPHGEDDAEVVVVSSQKSHTSKHSSNTERVIEHEIIRDGSQDNYPRIQANKDNATPYNYTVTTPGEQTPQGEFPGSPTKKPVNYDYPTQGVPAGRSPGYANPGESEPYNDYPAGTGKRPVNDYATTRPAAGLPSSPRKTPNQDYSTQGFPSVRSPSKGTPSPGYPSNVDGQKPNGTAEQPRGAPINKTQPRTASPNKYKVGNTTVRETTERVIRKEKEVDSNHRAFAASLRSSSPMDHIRRDSYTTDSHTRHTPRSSVSSTKTFRRDMREGSHDSAPSETSRISTNTITRNTPPRSVGGRTVVTKAVSTKTWPGSNDTLNVTSPRATKSPSPGKTVTTTTTTTTRTLNAKDVPKVTEKSPIKKQSSQPQPQPAPSSRSSTPSHNSRQPQTCVRAVDYDEDDDVDVDDNSRTSPFSTPSSRSRTPQKKITPNVINNDNDKTRDDWQMPRRQPDHDERRTVNRETTFERPDVNATTQNQRKQNYEQPQVEWIIVDDVEEYENEHDDDDDNDNDHDDDSFAVEVVDANLNVKKTTTKLITQEKQTLGAPQKRTKPITATTTTTTTTKQFPSKSQTKPNDKVPLKTKPHDSRTPSQQIRTNKTLTTDSKSPAQSPSKFQTKVVKAPKSVKPSSYTSPLRKPLLPNRTSTEEITLRKTLKTSQILKQDKTAKLIEAERQPKRKPQSPERKIKPQTSVKGKPNGVDEEEEETIVVTETSHRRRLGDDRKTPQQTVYEPDRTHYDDDDEPRQAISNYQPQNIYDSGMPQSPNNNNEPKQNVSPGHVRPKYEEPTEPHYLTPVIRPQPQDLDNKPRHKSPILRKPLSPGFQKLQSTFDERSPQFGKPPISDDDDIVFLKNPKDTEDLPITDNRSVEQHISISETSHTSYQPDRETPKRALVQKTPGGINKPKDKAYEPRFGTPGYRRPVDNEEPQQGLPDFRKPRDCVFEPQPIYEENVIITETSEKRIPKKEEAPKRRPQSPENKTIKQIPGFRKPNEAPEKPHQGNSPKLYRNKPVETDEQLSAVKPEFAPSETDDDDECVVVNTTESSVGTHQKIVAKHIEKFETNVLKTQSPKTPTRPQKPLQSLEKGPPDNKPKMGRSIREQLTDTEEDIQTFIISEKQIGRPHSQKPNRELSPMRQPKRPAAQNLTKEPVQTGYKSPERVVSPTRKPKHSSPENKGQRTQSPNKHISPNRIQRNLEPADQRTQKSPQRTPRPLDDDQIFTTTLKTTTKLIKEKLIQDINGEDYSENKPKSFKPRDGKLLGRDDDDELCVETAERVTSCTQNRLVSEESATLKPKKLTKSTNREDSPIKSPQRATSPNKNHSPTRTPKQPDQTRHSIEDQQTLTKNLHSTEFVIEKLPRKIADQDYPAAEKIPFMKIVKDEVKVYPQTLLDNETDETSETHETHKTCEFVINLTKQQQFVTEQNMRVEDFTRPQTGSPSRSPAKDISPTRGQRRPIEKLPEDKFKVSPEGRRPQSPNKQVSPTRSPKKPTSELVSAEDNETFTSTLTTENKVVKEQRSRQEIDEKKYPHIKKVPKTEADNKSPTREVAGKRPQSPNKSLSPIRKQMPNIKDDDDTISTFKSSRTTKKTVSEKLTQEVDDQRYPDERAAYNKGNKPANKPKEDKTYYDKHSVDDDEEEVIETFRETVTICKPQSREEPEVIHQTLIEKPKGPTREDGVFRTSLETTTSVTKKSTKNENREDHERSENIIPHKNATKPGAWKPYTHQPSANEDEEGEKPLNERLTTSKTLRVTEESRSPQEHKTTQKKPEQMNQEKKEIFQKTQKSSKFVTEKTEKTTEVLDTLPDKETSNEFKPKSGKPTETDRDEETFVKTTEFVYKTKPDKMKYPDAEKPDKKPQSTVDNEIFASQKLITTEQETLETERDLYCVDTKGLPAAMRSVIPKAQQISHLPKDRKQSPTRGPSASPQSNTTKTTIASDESFQKSLRITEKSLKIDQKKIKTEAQKSFPTDTDEEEDRTTDDTEDDLMIEISEKRNFVSEETNEEEQQNLTTLLLKPTKKKTEDKPSAGVEAITETIESRQTYPEDTEHLPDTSKYPKTKQPSEETGLSKRVSQYTKDDINEQFIEIERVRQETPDGGFISKTTEPAAAPTSPTFKKKGTGRSDTFEERCRKILGMESYGDTQGIYKKPVHNEAGEQQPKTVITKDNKTLRENDQSNAAVFQVKIEDCDEDKEPFSVNSAKKTLHKQVNTSSSSQQKYTEPLKEEPKNEDTEKPQKARVSKETFEHEHIYTEDAENDFVQTIMRPKISAVEVSESDNSGPETVKETFVKESKTSEIKIIKKTTPTSSPRSSSPTKSTAPPRSMSPNKATSTPEKHTTNKYIYETELDNSGSETVKETFVKESKTKKTTPTSSPRSSSPTKSTASARSMSPNKATSTPAKETPTRKPRKDSLENKSTKKSPQKISDDNNSSSSTIKDRLRSSARKTKSPTKLLDQPDGSAPSSPEHSPTRYTERRRSSNISVATEIIIEHTDADSPNKREKLPTTPKKPHDSSVYKDIMDSTILPEKLTRRLPVTERKESAPVHRVTSKDKDTKMSRSTSENLIKMKKPEPHSSSAAPQKTSTKTSDHRRPTKCFATKSINLSATSDHRRLINSVDTNSVIIDIQHAKSSREPSPDKIIPTPVPANLDTGKPRYPDVVQEPEDDQQQPKRNSQIKNIPIFEEENNSYVGCHITEINVEGRGHQQTIYDSMDYAEQTLENPLVEAPASLDYISLDKPAEDQSWLTVHEKVNKFQNITEDVGRKPPSQTTKLDVNEDHQVYSTLKLAATAPQKSPELVRTISKNISKQQEFDLDFNNEATEDDHAMTSHRRQHDDYAECLLVDSKKSTKEFKVSHREKTTTTEQTAEKYQQEYADDHDDDDQLIPHTATHTTIIEERRQKDILSRPSVFDSRNKTSTTPLKCNKTADVKESQKLRPDNKSRTKPTSNAVTHTTAEQTTATTFNKPQQQSPKPKNSNIDYELRGSSSSSRNIETGVKNIISKQTKVYGHNNSSDSKTNDSIKLTTTTTSTNTSTSNNKKQQEKHMPPPSSSSVRLTPAKHSDKHDLSADDDDDCDDYDDDVEMIVTLKDDIESQVVNETILNKETNTKIPLTTNTPHNKQPTTTHSSTNSSSTDRPLKTKTQTQTKEHLVKLTDKHPLKTNTVTSTATSIKTTTAATESADHIDETLLETTTKKSPPPAAHPHTKTNKMSTSTTDSVAARRSLFESNNKNSSISSNSNKRTPLANSPTTMSGRRPSYMDHTKSSLEHTRRDSLEINKTNYSRKTSPTTEEEVTTALERNSLVKFDVPHGPKRATTPRAISVSEDINVEEIFDVEVLEELMETVQSYEIRRRIRAQIRLIKKNQKNELISSSHATEITNTKTTKADKLVSEEPDTITMSSRKLSTTTALQTKEAAGSSSSSKKEYIFEEAYHPTTRRSPKPNRRYADEEERKPTRSQSPQHSPVCQRNAEHQRHHSPDQQHGARTPKPQQQYYYKDEHELEEEQEQKMHEIRHETSPNRKSNSPSRKPHSSNSSPDRSHANLKNNERSRSPQTKAPQSSRTPSSRSPDAKTSISTTRKSSNSYEQQETVNTTTTTTNNNSNNNNKPQTKRVTTSNTPTTKSKPEDKTTPVWADRKNILKAATSTTTPTTTTTPKKAPSSSSTLESRSAYTTKTSSKSTISQQKMSSTNKSSLSSFVDEDCVTSSYGIGPTDENGLPLFGIRALKKKKSPVEASETTEEVTGYVVEEKYYSDNKTKPTVERKEFIYSTNPEELQKLKQQVQSGTANRKALQDVELKESRKAALITKAPPALRATSEDDFLDSTTKKYVRRGSVKEMSEKFIQKEAASSSSATTVTEKSNYPKAGLILRTNSRKSSRDMDNEIEHFESYKAARVQQHHTSSAVLADSDDNQHDDDYEVEEVDVDVRHSGRFITESESECDSIKTQREFKKVTSSSSSSMATRSFLNSQGEEKHVTNVSDCLERMRNADNVVEEGDTAEDQEARALLNKFLGASIIMKGVESSLPATNRQSKIITTTTTSCSNLSDDNDGDNNAKHEVKTTRITKTINSGSSSTPVTYTTCDIEEIWDEEVLKELLEQARTYEERRKIRSRLRELMADREETNKSPKGDGKNETTVAAANVVVAEEEEESSASEYEEIIEEVTDYSEAESEVDENTRKEKVVSVVSEKQPAKDKTAATAAVAVTRTEEKSVSVTAKPEASAEQVEATKTVIKTETVEEVVEEYDDQTDSSEKGECLKPIMHAKQTQQTTLQQQTMPQQAANAHSNPSTNSQKLKSAQTSASSNSKCKATVSESGSSMHASYNNSNYRTPKATSATPIAKQNPVVTTERTAGRADATSISNKNNNTSSSNTNIHNNNNDKDKDNVKDSSSVSGLGVKAVVVGSSSSNSPRQVDRLGVPPKEDSGTESGEDLRLIAAGLRDQLQNQSASNIIEDVTCALSRLENSLKEGKDISVDIEKRKALLALVARLRAGLTSPEKLAEIAAAMSELDGNEEGLYGETSSPEADAHRSNRSRFGKRRNRVNRHTVGVSREELADARRYMEDMLLMSNISQSSTPDASSMSNSGPPQWYPVEKNASTSAIIGNMAQPSAPVVLQRPKQFVTEQNTTQTNSSCYSKRSTVNSGKRRPLSGEYSVSFENSEPEESAVHDVKPASLEDSSKVSRFINKKHLMKRANTIDLAKAHKYNPDSDSDAEDKSGSHAGLKRAVQVSVKKRVQNDVPAFEPKTENDRKFLAFINKQSDKPGLGWTTSRSVSNWTNKFGSIKNTFEGGLAGKPPQAPYHASSVNTKLQQTSKLFSQPAAMNSSNASPLQSQQIALRLQREAERQAEERKRKLEKEHAEYERRERDKLERQRQQRERQERERLEREHFERLRREQDQITAAKHAAILREQKQLAAAQQTAANNNTNAAQHIAINEFKHAPQSVFRPIESDDTPSKTIYKPIAQLARNSSNWQPYNATPNRSHTSNNTAPGQYGNTRPDNSFITSPPPSTRSPIALPWASKPTVDSSSFKSKAHRFEERSKYDNINYGIPFVQRHNSLRSSNAHHISEDFRKRPSLPNTSDPYSVGRQMPMSHDPLSYLPPPQNISFTYSSFKPNHTHHQSYPCLPSAVVNNNNNDFHEMEYPRPRVDSLTNPHSVPLVLTSANPLYCPAAPSPASTQPQPQSQQQHPASQSRLTRQFDLASPANSTPTSPSIYNMQQTDGTDEDIDSDNNLLEYHAVSRVMRKPQCQTAVTVGRRTGHVSDDELYGKNSRAAKNLLSTMKSLGNSNGTTRTKAPAIKRPEAVTSPKTCLSPQGLPYQAPLVEPLFPEINKFENNRTPVYVEECKKQTAAAAAPTYTPQTAPRTQLGMYKSMENLNRSPAKSQAKFVQETPSKPSPYLSETQTSYVVTYPIEDTKDDEDFRRLGQNKMTPPHTLDFQRHRNTSEHSTGSSNLTATSFNPNLPSPNTNWTSNPIVCDESSYYQNMTRSYQHNNINLQSAQNYKTATEYEASAQRQMPPSLKPTHNATTTQHVSTQAQTTTNYEDSSKKQVQQNTTSQKQALPEMQQKLAEAQKHITAKTITSNVTIQEKKSLTSSLRKTEDLRSIPVTDQTVLNPKNSNISQEMLMRLEQQRQRLSNEERRKSLGNTLDYQMEKQACYEAHNAEVYKSSAPPDTPDIVKSSLPKDETQPILKKFGPPQRHHYMPNSYQSPSANTASSTTVVSTTIHSRKAQTQQGKHVHSSSSKQTQQVFSNTNRPTVMETPATPQPDDDYIPRNIVYNNVHAFSSMARRRQEEEETAATNHIEQQHTIRPSKLCKSDSWNQIMLLQSRQQVQNHTTTKFNQSPTNELRRTKSGHTLALPKMFEANMTKVDINEKQKTVAAYFSGQRSPITQQPETLLEQMQQTTKRSVINRTKTSDKVSAASRKSLGATVPTIVSGGLQRSATMPHIAQINLLDESNVEDAFEQLIMEQKQQKSCSSTTEKTETKEKDGAVVTTTTKVTTRTVTGSAEKPASPFAKFKQLDGQNSQQSTKSPKTPTTTVGGSTASPLSGNQPIFKFTDPALNAKAATVKEQLLQWCQSKTQEYENIEITNFSTSWNNGLAFCALIHHFLPDAFDYSQLTPKNRRKNFELAFTVADEKAGIAPLLDVEDMVVMQRPDWKCVFVYVQSIYRRFRNCQ